MAEIKSTLDLVMEKTRHMILTDEEKEALELREHLKQTVGFVRQVLDGTWPPTALLDHCAKIPEKVRPDFIAALVRRLLEHIDFSDKGRRCLAALKALADDRPSLRIAELEQLFNDYDKRLRQIRASHQDPVLNELAAAGISGDAVVVRHDRSPVWKQQERRLHDRLQALRQDLLSLYHAAP